MKTNNGFPAGTCGGCGAPDQYRMECQLKPNKGKPFAKPKAKAKAKAVFKRRACAVDDEDANDDDDDELHAAGKH